MKKVQKFFNLKLTEILQCRNKAQEIHHYRKMWTSVRPQGTKYTKNRKKMTERL